MIFVKTVMMMMTRIIDDDNDDGDDDDDDDDEKKVKCFDQVPRTECRSVPRNVCNPVFPIVQSLTHHHIITILIMILRMDKNQVCTPTYFCESCEQQAAPFEVSPLLQTMNEH